MAKRTRSEAHISRRMRLRVLHVFCTVVDTGSMAQAAAQLGVSTPSVSEVISGLEHEVGVRLLERTPRGVVATVYGEVLWKRANAAFDDLRLGIRDIEALADPQGGEVQIGCPESITPFLASVIERLAAQSPRMRFSVQQVHWPAVDFPELRARKVDIVLGRLPKMPANNLAADDIAAEVLFDDPFTVVVGGTSIWARRNKVVLADLIDEPWICTPLDVLAGRFLVEAFESQGLKAPVPKVATSSIQLRNILASSGRFVAVLPHSVLKFSAKRYGLRQLPIKLSDGPAPVAAMMLRGRTLTPAVEAFMECVRCMAVPKTGHGLKVG